MAEARRTPIDLESPDRGLLARVGRLLLEGEVVAAPSDTVYGLLALPRSARGREGLARIKERAGPFIVLIAGWEEARSWTRDVPEELWTRLRRVWPGPVTAILPTAPAMPGAKDGTIGIRMPRSPLLTALLTEVGEPLFSTSANRPGQDPPVSADEVVSALGGDDVALVLDGGRADSREPSTLVDLTVSPPRVLRAGRGDASGLLDPSPGPS